MCLAIAVQELFTEMSGTVAGEDGTAMLHHRAIAEWLVSDEASPPLRVSLPAARQAMSDAVMSWLAPVISDQQAEDNGTATSVDCLNGVKMQQLLQRCVYFITTLHTILCRAVLV